MKPAPFRYVRADHLDEALAVLAEQGSDARVLAGGQSLGAMLNMRIVTPEVLLDVNRIDALSGIRTDGGALRTGALTRQRDAMDDEAVRARVPLLSQALPFVGHYQTRNRGTLGGSVVHADPSAEIPLVLATLDGEVELRSRRRSRKVAAGSFFRSALTTARDPDEIVSALRWPVSRSSERFSFAEFAIREGDFAIVAVACALDIEKRQICLGFGGCGEVPQIVRRAVPDFAPSVTNDLIQATIENLEYRRDLLASAAYRRELASVLATQTIANALAGEKLDA